MQVFRKILIQQQKQQNYRNSKQTENRKELPSPHKVDL